MSISNAPLRVFDESVVEFLGELSAELLKSPIVRRHPDLSAFAFYVRKANLARLQGTMNPGGGRLGRGLCFHIAPANIPVNFAFSWVFSLLAGNANVVRLPSRDFPQVDALLEVVDGALGRHPALRERNAFVKYPRTDVETTAMYSAMADCRMIWGGDRTIAAIRAMPTMPRCVDVCFADRYSVALIDGAAVLAADDARIARLAEDFYNDTYLMDQNACSSPQVILWESDSPSARERFWTAVEAVAKRKYVLQDAVAVDKYTMLCEEAAGSLATGRVTRAGNLLYRVELEALPKDVFAHRGRGGLFFEHSLKSREGLFEVVTEKFQTVTQFGIDALALRDEIVSHGLRGIDRIVPIGQAMDIGAVWDGYNLVETLSRTVSAS